MDSGVGQFLFLKKITFAFCCLFCKLSLIVLQIISLANFVHGIITKAEEEGGKWPKGNLPRAILAPMSRCFIDKNIFKTHIKLSFKAGGNA